MQDCTASNASFMHEASEAHAVEAISTSLRFVNAARDAALHGNAAVRNNFRPNMPNETLPLTILATVHRQICQILRNHSETKQVSTCFMLHTQTEIYRLKGLDYLR